MSPTDSNDAGGRGTQADLEAKLRRTFQAVGRSPLEAGRADVASPERPQVVSLVHRRKRVGVALVAVAVVAALVGLLIAFGPKNGSRGPKTTQAAHPPTLPTTTATAPTTPSPPATNIVAAALPVVTCATQFALATPPPTTAVPATLVVQVPDDLRSTLAVYTDTEELELVLAPRGWHCQAGYGADGSGSISVYPSGESTPNPFSEVTIRADSQDEAITLSETGGSPVIAADTACPYFADAAGQAQQYGVGNCTRPVNLVVDPISQTAVGVALSAGQSASGIPSGGLYVTNALVLYTPTTQPGTYEGSCTLPQDEHAICTAVLNNMLSRYSGK